VQKLAIHRPQHRRTPVMRRWKNNHGGQTRNCEIVVALAGHWRRKCMQNIGMAGICKGLWDVGPSATDRRMQGKKEGKVVPVLN
jgi:hypothetical protein